MPKSRALFCEHLALAKALKKGGWSNVMIGRFFGVNTSTIRNALLSRNKTPYNSCMDKQMVKVIQDSFLAALNAGRDAMANCLEATATNLREASRQKEFTF
jgi:hypothetical protein